MGAWLRLRDDVDLSGLGPQARVIAEGLQRHGLVLADTSNAALRAARHAPTAAGTGRTCATIGQLDAQDFEVVDHGGIMVAPDSMAARPPPG